MEVRSRIPAPQIILFILAAITIMAFRYGTLHYVSNSLWAEDGPVFYQDASEYGLASLLKPYAGYLHLYPRLVAILSMVFPASLIPFVFFGGWLASIVLLFWTLRRALADRPHYAALAFIIPLLAIMQPHSGETFLSLTNAQWWLASSLAVIASMPWMFGRRVTPIAVVLSLTGPFSVLIFPVAAIQCWRHKRYALLIAMAVGAAAQVAMLLSNPRPSQELDQNIYHWLSNIELFFTFGGASTFVTTISVVFWVGFLISMIRPAAGSYALISCAFFIYAASMYSLKGMPAEISPINNAARYFVIPYTLIVIAALINMRIEKPLYVLPCIALVAVFIGSFHKSTQADMNYSAYAKLSAFERRIMIPIAPFVEGQQGFYIHVNNSAPKAATAANPVPLEDGRALIAKGICAGKRGVGFAADLTVNPAGYVTLYWKDDNDTEYKSVRRWYSKGSQRIQFAFPKGKRPVELQIHSTTPITSASLSNAVTACL